MAKIDARQMSGSVSDRDWAFIVEHIYKHIDLYVHGVANQKGDDALQ